MGHEPVDARQPAPVLGCWGVSRIVSPGPNGMMGYGCSYVGWHEPCPGWSHPLRSPRRRQGQLCDIISRLQTHARRFEPRSDWIPEALPGVRRADGGADHLRIPDLIQICHVCKGRGLPSICIIRWCEKWDVHRARGIGVGCISRGVAGPREFQGLATANAVASGLFS